MQMPGRNGGEDYRYAFNGMEHDPEVSGDGNSYTTEFRQYDPRLGRWKSLDPLMAKFPHQSPYVAFDNNPIVFDDPLGLAAGNPEDDALESFRMQTLSVTSISSDGTNAETKLVSRHDNTLTSESSLTAKDGTVYNVGDTKGHLTLYGINRNKAGKAGLIWGATEQKYTRNGVSLDEYNKKVNTHNEGVRKSREKYLVTSQPAPVNLSSPTSGQDLVNQFAYFNQNNPDHYSFSNMIVAGSAPELPGLLGLWDDAFGDGIVKIDEGTSSYGGEGGTMDWEIIYGSVANPVFFHNATFDPGANPLAPGDKHRIRLTTTGSTTIILSFSDTKSYIKASASISGGERVLENLKFYKR
jgi:RHS repeat-associated protein